MSPSVAQLLDPSAQPDWPVRMIVRRIEPRGGSVSYGSILQWDALSAMTGASVPTLKQRYQERIDELSRYCEEEDIKINDTSIQGFWDFLDELKSPKTLGLVTTHTGNLRAVWETDESYFAVEFLGDDRCEYVMWSPVTQPTSKYCTITESRSILDTIRNEENAR